MLHAEIRSGRDAFHFIGEVSGYNLQTLREHVRQTAREDGAVHLRVNIDPDDQLAFRRYTGKWLPRLAAAGTTVEVNVTATP
jgi:hypothetical protein